MLYIVKSPIGTTIKFNPPIGIDSMMKDGVSISIGNCMKEYENKSLEPLIDQKNGSAGLFGNTATAQTSAFGGPPVFGGFGATNQQSPLLSQSTGSSSLFETPAFEEGLVFGSFGATNQQSVTSCESEVLKPTNPFAEIAVPYDKQYKLALLGTTRTKPKPWTPSPSEKSKLLFGNIGTADIFRSGSLFDQPAQNENSRTTTTLATHVFNFGDAGTMGTGASLLGQSNQQKESEVLKLTTPSAENAFLNDNQYKLALVGSIKVKPKPWTPSPSGKTLLFEGLGDEEPSLENVELLLKRIMNELVLKKLGISRSKFILTSDVYEKSDPITKIEFSISVKISNKPSSEVFADTSPNSVPLTVDISDKCVLELSGSHFKKEVLQQLVAEFIEECYKPCQLFSSDKASRSSEKKKESNEVTDDKDDNIAAADDEILIIYIKLRKYKKLTVNAETEERLKIVQEQEEMINHCKKEQLDQRLSVDTQVSSESPEPKLPELTSEMEEEIDKALHGGEPDEQLCKISSDSSYYLLRSDIETLKELKWLNDTIIDSYFALIVERSKQEGYPSVYAYSSFFYSTYKAKGYSGVRQWTQEIDIFSYDLNFVPLHQVIHWGLAVIDHRSKKVCYYDSMSSRERICLSLLHEYLCLEYKDKKDETLDPNIYVTEVMKDIPQQKNGSDCGMFTLKYAEYISRDTEMTFSQNHMGCFRRRMVYELLHNQLL